MGRCTVGRTEIFLSMSSSFSDRDRFYLIILSSDCRIIHITMGCNESRGAQKTCK